MTSIKPVDSVGGKTKQQSNTQQTNQQAEEETKEESSSTRKVLRWLFIFSLALVLSALFTASYLFYEGFSPKSIQLQNPVREIFRIKSDEPITTKAPQKLKTASVATIQAQPVANSPKAQ